MLSDGTKTQQRLGVQGFVCRATRSTEKETKAPVPRSEKNVPEPGQLPADREGRQDCGFLSSARLPSFCAQLPPPAKYCVQVIQDPKTRRAGTQGDGWMTLRNQAGDR